MTITIPQREWSRVECYVYPNLIYDDVLKKDVEVAPTGATYRLDNSGHYVQERSATEFFSRSMSLEQARMRHPGYVFDDFQLLAELVDQEMFGNSVKFTVSGW